MGPGGLRERKMADSIIYSIFYYIYVIEKIENQIILFFENYMKRCVVFRDNNDIIFNYLRFFNQKKSNKIGNQIR